MGPNLWLSPTSFFRWVLALLLLANWTVAQSSLDKGTPAESKPGTSTPSTYAPDKLETVNLANGNLSMNVPLVNIGGRGSASLTIGLFYNSKAWSTEHEKKKPEPTLRELRFHTSIIIMPGTTRDRWRLQIARHLAEVGPYRLAQRLRYDE
jgi:hypothetical protein